MGVIKKSDSIVRTVSKQIYSTKSDGVINVHRCNTENVGDLVCAPYSYFEELDKFNKVDILDFSIRNPQRVIKWYTEISHNDIILGGGGLFDRASFKESIAYINALILKGKKVVPWGVGHNSPSLKPTLLFDEQLSNYKLVGVRDYMVPKTTWVPCVSCMASEFDSNNMTVLSEFGVIVHEHIDIKGIQPDMQVLHNNSSFTEIVNFIKSVDKVITNSYHAMYWSMLLNKEVYVIPNSSKMYSFKYKPVFIENINQVSKNKESLNYSGVLEECRYQNLIFKEKVYDYLNIV